MILPKFSLRHLNWCEAFPCLGYTLEGLVGLLWK